MTDDYVELRVRSAFSFLAGASLPEDLVARAAALDFDTVAIVDRDGVYGAPRAFRAAQANGGLRTLIGADVEIENGRLALLATDCRGYRNLCKLLTRGKMRSVERRGALGWGDLEEHAGGLIALVPGDDDAMLAHLDDAADARARLDRLQAFLGTGSVYVEIHRHFESRQAWVTRRLIALAEACRIPLVATNDVRHACPNDRRLLDVLTCVRNKTTLDAAGRLLAVNAERHLKSAREMRALFRDVPDAVSNTRRIAERCVFTLADLDYQFPSVPLPQGATQISHLRALVERGARRRYGTITARIRAQLEHELGVIERLDLTGYFLIVWDIVEFCRQQGILVQGRGSAANSAVCFVLGITAVDPIGMDLLFERFLSEERGGRPDIDIDLPGGRRREAVIQYVYRRYGAHGAAMTANVVTYRSRSAVREVGKVLGFGVEPVARLASLLRAFEFRDPDDEVSDQLAAAGFDVNAPRARLLVDLVRRMQNLPRHLGQHPGGMVLAAGRLDEVVPLEPATMSGRVVVQWDKDDCADLGIIKVDLLGLGMMAVLEDAIPLVREHDGVDLDLAHLPHDDHAVYKMLQRADTVGVFQVESRAQMATLPRLKPACFYDLVVEVAIVRPGPIVGEMVHPYLRRRAKREPVTYPHPSLQPILERTLGVPLFQEQLLRIAMTAAGFSGGEAEELRRAMGFKRSAERMAQIERRLRAGMAERGIVGTAADEIVRSIMSFALYGFPESHSASFALITYASAYLKVHHPASFYCALLNNWPMGFYHPATLVKDAERHGVVLRPIDVMRSAWDCTIEDGALRIGLRYVGGLREATGRRIEEERRRMPFATLADLVARTGLQENERRRLAFAGACAAFGARRRDVLWQMAALDHRPAMLFGAISVENKPASGAEGASPLPIMLPIEETLADYASMGLTIGPHVMAHLRTTLRAQRVITSAEVRNVPYGRYVRIAGHVIVRQRPGTAKGMLFLTIEDETGTCNVAVRPDVFRAHRRLLQTAQLLRVEGPLQNVDGVIHVLGRVFAAFETDDRLSAIFVRCGH
ncbi:MAG: error-prone DNA polymerase [Myxococcales bacterium]|jgi:error-prone DNA polymerase|nr:error-prone DNA polymerase [Myxococcales bacterium]